MVQQRSDPSDLPPDIEQHAVQLSTSQFPTRTTPSADQRPAQHSLHRPRSRKGLVRRHEIRQVTVLGVSCRLRDVVQQLDHAIQLALAGGPRGVVCDLSAVQQGDEPFALETLARAGRHVRDWPGVPVAVACPDPKVREALRAQHLIVTTSLFTAVSAVLATPAMALERLRLAPHPTAARASREFVTRTLLRWGAGPTIPFASLIISELVTSSTIDAGTDIELSVAWDLRALRLTVRDHGPALPGQPQSGPDLQGRRLALVSGLSRSFGVLPAADGGTVLWAVLAALQPPLSTSPHRSAEARQESLILSDARGMAQLPTRASSVPVTTCGSSDETVKERPSCIDADSHRDDTRS
jgi:hypothetical protein